MRFPFALGILVVSATLAGLPGSLDNERDIAAILEVHRQNREGHFKTDADMILAGAAAEVVQVGQGRLRRVPKAETRDMLAANMRGAKYLEWDDLEPPVIRVSADGTMAWLAIRVRSKRTKKDAQGVEREEAFVFAGLTALEKQNGKWARVAMATTFE